MKDLSNSLTKFSFFFLVLFSLIFTACDDDEGMDVTEQEFITTVQMEFIEFPDSTITSFAFQDADGAGGAPPIVDTIILKNNTTYVYRTIFLDESDPADVHDLTEEIVTENDEHLVCYLSTGATPAWNIGDQDSNAQPLGLIGAIATDVSGSGGLQVVLKHQPDKDVADACTTGETDVEVLFPVEVE